MSAFAFRAAAGICAVAAAASLASAALSLAGVDIGWPVAVGVALIAIFADAGAIGWPTALLSALFFAALAFGFAGLHALVEG